MIYAIKHNKVNRSIYKANEDALTSSIFERLMYLPKELISYIFQSALFDNIANLDIDKVQSIEYWLNWNPENTTNSNKVEPDIFIRTKNNDIIIEAKRYDKKQQSKTQWRNEIQSYLNEYSEENKPLIFIALGGLHTVETETIEVSNEDFKIYKCTWQAILNSIKSLTHELEQTSTFLNSNAATLNVLNDMVLCFSLFGYSTADWFERFLPNQNIKSSSINKISMLWKN